MSHAQEPSRFVRGFYVLSAALIAAVAAGVLLQILLSTFYKGANGEALISLFFLLNLVGHKIRNYLWANLLGVSVLVAIRALGVHPARSWILESWRALFSPQWRMRMGWCS